jgi:hypothetical protein
VPSDTDHETLKHIRRVQSLLAECAQNLTRRAIIHDSSKLCAVESSVFEEYTPKLKQCEYGSDEYKGYLAAMKPALDHHYSHNRHHPEHWPGGIGDMTLLDLLEMIVDWKAASERHDTGDIARSVEVNQHRFGYGDQLKKIFLRTVGELFPHHREPWHCFACGSGGCEGNFCEMCGAGKHDYDPKAELDSV